MLKRDMLYLLSQPSTPDKIDFRTKAITRVVSFLFPSAGLAPRRKQFLTAVAQTDLWPDLRLIPTLSLWGKEEVANVFSTPQFVYKDEYLCHHDTGFSTSQESL